MIETYSLISCRQLMKSNTCCEGCIYSTHTASFMFHKNKTKSLLDAIFKIFERFQNVSIVAKPDVAKPDVAKPDVAKPDVAKPDVA